MSSTANRLPPYIDAAAAGNAKVMMNAMLERFFPDVPRIQANLRQTYSFIAGSAPLYAVKPWGKGLDGFDGDIDIWSCTGYKYDLSSGAPVDMDRVRMHNMSVSYWEHEMAMQGYAPDYRVPAGSLFIDPQTGKSAMRVEDMYTHQSSMRTVVSRVLHFVHPTKKTRVQVILCKEHDIRTVLNSFDYSFCAVAWDGHSIRSDYFDDIRNGFGRILNETRLLPSRTEKYTARGFLVPAPSV
jgi:hypothetical protein